MKLASYLWKKKENLGLIIDDKIYPLSSLNFVLPETMSGMLKNWDHLIAMVKRAEDKIREDKTMQSDGILLKAVQLLTPVPIAGSLRDGYAFRQHVETARRNRGLPMTEIFDEFPVFYFGNHRTIVGPGAISCMPDHFKKLDFELEVAILITRKGKNIRVEDADQHIGGLMIMNDFSARTLQMEEMLLSLGPAKGKDFATAIGPILVTPDELKGFEISAGNNHKGKRWNLEMKAEVNGKLVSQGNLGDMDWTFAELIERASYGVELYPGDIIGSGTVGTGCFLELNGTAKLAAREHQDQWLKPGDEVTLSVQGLGELVNTLVQTEVGYSILERKKIKSPK